MISFASQILRVTTTEKKDMQSQEQSSVQGQEQSSVQGQDQSSAKPTDAASRAEVFKAIDEERNYQENKWGNKPSLETEFLIIQDYMETYRSKWTKERGNDSFKELMRIVATTAVRAMENHGVVQRSK